MITAIALWNCDALSLQTDGSFSSYLLRLGEPRSADSVPIPGVNQHTPWACCGWSHPRFTLFNPFNRFNNLTLPSFASHAFVSSEQFLYFLPRQRFGELLLAAQDGS